MIVTIAATAGAALTIAGLIAWLYWRGPRFVDAFAAMVVAEPASRAIGRAESVVRSFPKYTYRKVGSKRLEIIHSAVEADVSATDASPEIASAVLDMLLIEAAEVATGTEIRVHGRAEPKLVDALRRALAEAPAPHPTSPRTS